MPTSHRFGRLSAVLAAVVLIDHWPTVDALFDQAMQAGTNGMLHGITYDPVLDYPSRIDLAGAPDASGSVYASGLQPAP